MLTTAATKLIDHREDGTLRDLDPRRRAARLSDAGVAIERWGAWDHVVRVAPADLAHFRTRRGAEQHAHAAADARRPEAA